MKIVLLFFIIDGFNDVNRKSRMEFLEKFKKETLKKSLKESLEFLVKESLDDFCENFGGISKIIGERFLREY